MGQHQSVKIKKNGKKNAFALQRSKYIPMHEIPNTNNLIQKERSLKIYSYLASIIRYQLTSFNII